MGKNKCPVGVWKGEYFFDLEEQKLPDGSGVVFDLRLTQSWLQRHFGWFSGVVQDDPQRGVPDTGRVYGSVKGSFIQFTKRLPVAYTLYNGSCISLDEWLKLQGCTRDIKVPHPPIYYNGSYLTDNEASGTWRIEEGSVQSDSYPDLFVAECTGTWKMRRVG